MGMEGCVSEARHLVQKAWPVTFVFTFARHPASKLTPMGGVDPPIHSIPAATPQRQARAPFPSLSKSLSSDSALCRCWFRGLSFIPLHHLRFGSAVSASSNTNCKTTEQDGGHPKSLPPRGPGQ